MLEELKQEVFKANMSLPAHGLVKLTWGNVSGLDRKQGLVVIKPSGVAYDQMRAEQMVVVDLEGQTVEGELKPSSDTATHLELYRKFDQIGGIVHTHSRYATIFAQNKQPIKALGTTHADHFHGPVPCTRPLTDEEINGQYELNTGLLITQSHPDYEGIPAVLVALHGPFTWGRNPAEAVINAVVLEEIALMAFHCSEAAAPVSQTLLDKHYFRKHGAGAYYGQK
jgi:L-ribulose-5-phosphate 4-epimerase